MESYKLLADFQTSSGTLVACGTTVQVSDLDPSGWWLATWAEGSDWLPSSYLEKCPSELSSVPISDASIYGNSEPEPAVSDDIMYSNENVRKQISESVNKEPTPAEDTYSVASNSYFSNHNNIAASSRAPVEETYSVPNHGQMPKLPHIDSVYVNNESACESADNLSKEELSLLYAVPKKKPAPQSDIPIDEPPPPPPAQFSDDDGSDGSGDEAPLGQATYGAHSFPAPPPVEPEYSTLYEACATGKPVPITHVASAQAAAALAAPSAAPSAAPARAGPPVSARPVGAQFAAAAAVIADMTSKMASPGGAPPPVKPKRVFPGPAAAAAAIASILLEESQQASASRTPSGSNAGPQPPPPPVFGVPPTIIGAPPPATPAPPPPSGALAPVRKAPPPPPGALPHRAPSRTPSTKGPPPPPAPYARPPAAPGALPGPQIIADAALPITTSLDIRINSELAADLATLRESLAGWTSPDGVRTQFRLLHHGRLMKISKGKAQCRDFFLFDHLLVYCKRERRKAEVRGELPMVELLFKGRCDCYCCLTFLCVGIVYYFLSLRGGCLCIHPYPTTFSCDVLMIIPASLPC